MSWSVLNRVHMGEPISKIGLELIFGVWPDNQLCQKMPHPAMCISRRQVQRPTLTKFLCLHVSRKDRTNVHQPHIGILRSLLTAAAIRNFLLLAPLWLSLVLSWNVRHRGLLLFQAPLRCLK